MRQLVLDTETTGLNATDDRIIQVGCVELMNRRFTGNNKQWYINPGRSIEIGALQVHGITEAFLADKPSFKQIVAELIEYLKGAELIIHNASFDVGFLNAELQRIDARLGTLEKYCAVFDTLPLARRLHPGQRNSLDALCKRYNVNNAHRQWHGALLDAELLAQVYLAMTGGQVSLFDEVLEHASMPPLSFSTDESTQQTTVLNQRQGIVIEANATELAAHEAFLQEIIR